MALVFRIGRRLERRPRQKPQLFGATADLAAHVNGKDRALLFYNVKKRAKVEIEDSRVRMVSYVNPRTGRTSHMLRAVDDDGTQLTKMVSQDVFAEFGSIIEVASIIDRALIEQVHRSPGDLRTIDCRLFEQLVAELFAGFGYEVELTQRTRDGGKDIIAVKRCEVDLKLLIECKRPDPGNPVGVAAVRELYGVKIDDAASKAILAATTYFSPDAKEFSERHRWELELKDYEDIHTWINEYVRSKDA